MKTNHTFIGGSIAVTPSKWIRPVLMTLALLAAVFVATGCDGSRDSDHHGPGHHGDHRNQAPPTGGKL